VEIVVKGRNCEVPDRFRIHVVDKLGKLEKFEHRPLRVDVELAKERNPRQSDIADRIELTAHARGPVIRAEAAAADPYAALDLAYAKLEARLRKMADRRRVHHGQRRTPGLGEVAGATTPDGSTRPFEDRSEGPAAGRHNGVPAASSAPADSAATDSAADRSDDGPMVVREKVHQAKPMTLDQALYEMELVGHDFYLFVDQGTARPSVVYRRRAYDYGVIRLDV
jgi:ribosomal subunit interface protein